MTLALHTRSWRTGRPVLFIHGLAGSGQYWGALGGGDRSWGATAVDLLGFGDSPKPESAAYDVATHVAALRPHVVEGSILVAHSTGCVIAAALAAAEPSKVRGVVLVGTPAFTDESEARQRIGALGPLARWTVDGRARARWACHAMCHLRPLAMAVAPALLGDLPPEVARDAAKHTWTSYSRTLQHVVVEHRIADDLAGLDVPIRFVHGDADRSAPFELVEQLLARPALRRRDIALHVVPGGDHHVALRRRDEVVAVIDDLLGRH